MAYIYEISYYIHPDQMNELEIGQSLERVLEYLRARLPEEEGYISARVLYSIDKTKPIRVVMWSEWQEWEDFQAHLNSTFIEDKVLLEFDSDIKSEGLTTTIFNEVK